ncbi:SET domain-containing protein [Stipitochalara longipes BDJ]|nr:SET domain-containing protein [Stipitochalara longipes BDJ]
MDIHEKFTEWAIEKGVKINGIRPHRFEGRGLGIIADKDLKAGETLLSVPLLALRTAYTVPKSLTRALPKTSTIHSLLATDLLVDTSSARAPWHAVLPSPLDFATSMPLLWHLTLQSLLPATAAKLLANQQRKLKLDWAAVSKAFPNIKYEDYIYRWLIINTRTFYFLSPLPAHQKLHPSNRDDCMAQSPFADYFNHTSSPSACSASFSPSGYTISTPVKIKKGEEVYISYGNHSNDFLLTEYGFILSEEGGGNQWDEVPLDAYIVPLFSAKQKERLEERGFFGKYVLDRTDVCYRTQVALRILVLPVKKWERFVDGMEDGEKEQGAVDKVLGKVLREFGLEAKEKIEEVEGLDEDMGMEYQRDMLRRRWAQIERLIQAAIDRIQA